MKIIDIRSDTVTLPTDEMRRAMSEAEVGDDVFGEDPTVNRLEELAARMLGKEAALFTASGTMSNLVAVLTHTHPGDEIILGGQAHTFWYEVGGAAALAGVMMHTIAEDANGRMGLDAIEAAIRPQNIHFPPTTLLCLENTHNRCGGAALTVEYTYAACELARSHGLKVHLDGARIFNAAIALNVPASKLAKPADSVCVCLSKGLSAPVGSVLCGTKEFVEKARKWRKMVGGGMRQAGVIAAAGIVALEKMVDRLAEDHANARYFASGLAKIPGIVVQPYKVQTNIVVFEPPAAISANEFLDQMNSQGVRLVAFGGRRVRGVTHRMVDKADIDEVLSRIERFVRQVGK